MAFVLWNKRGQDRCNHPCTLRGKHLFLLGGRTLQMGRKKTELHQPHFTGIYFPETVSVYCILLLFLLKPFYLFQWPSSSRFTSYWRKNKTHLPSFKGIVSWDDVSAVLADQELDPIIEWMQTLLGDGGLCLLDDIQGVWGAQAQRVDVAQGLQAAVWVHAIHQAIYRKIRKIRANVTWIVADFMVQEHFTMQTERNVNFTLVQRRICYLKAPIKNIRYELISVYTWKHMHTQDQKLKKPYLRLILGHAFSHLGHWDNSGDPKSWCVFFLSVHIPMIFVHCSCCLYKSQATCITPKLAGSLSAVLDSGESHDIYHGYREI